jgi:hypothetical protein
LLKIIALIWGLNIYKTSSPLFGLEKINGDGRTISSGLDLLTVRLIINKKASQKFRLMDLG